MLLQHIDPAYWSDTTEPCPQQQLGQYKGRGGTVSPSAYLYIASRVCYLYVWCTPDSSPDTVARRIGFRPHFKQNPQKKVSDLENCGSKKRPLVIEQIRSSIIFFQLFLVKHETCAFGLIHYCRLIQERDSSRVSNLKPSSLFELKMLVEMCSVFLQQPIYPFLF